MNNPIPQSDNTLLIFPYKPEQKSFDCSFYTEEMTDGKLSEFTMGEILRNVVRVDKNHIYAFWIVTIMCGGGVLIPCLCSGDPDTILSGLGILLCVVIFFGVPLICCNRKSSEDKRKEAEVYLNKVNQHIRHMGLKWVVPKGVYPSYLELYKEYEFRYQPPNFINVHQNGPQLELGMNYSTNDGELEHAKLEYVKPQGMIHDPQAPKYKTTLDDALEQMIDNALSQQE